MIMYQRFAALAFGLVAACASTTPVTNVAFEGTPPSRDFRFTYQTELPAEGAGDELRLWLPIPVNTAEQKISNLEIEASHDYVVNDLVEGTGRSLYVESTGEPIAVTISYDVHRMATAGGGTASATELAAALEADTMIPLDGKAGLMAASVNDGTSAVETAEALYLHTLDRMRYDKPAGGDWGRGDADWACDSRFGNCTDFHSYFMAMARAKGIPARFVMGFPIVGGDEETAKVGGYHCWAYFYDAAEGWRPVDISEADKHPDMAQFFFGNLDENRVEVIGGRDVQLDPAPAAGSLNLFIYPHAEVNGKSTRKLTKSFSRKNL